jgi:hypothetical protein
MVGIIPLGQQTQQRRPLDRLGQGLPIAPKFDSNLLHDLSSESKRPRSPGRRIEVDALHQVH